MAGGIGGDDEEYIQLNLTAMVDVVMLLIIFFVSNLKFPREEGTLSAELPKKAAPGGTQVDHIDKIVIGIDYPGKRVRFTVNGLTLDGVKALDTKLFLLKRSANQAEVTLDAMPDVPYEYVVKVFDLCAKNNFKKVSFAKPHGPGL